MSTGSKIEWTESTWNPVTGCTKISSGCKNCYAERMAYRLRAMGQVRYKDGFKVALHPDALDEPYRWKKSRIVFVNSMSDLFHKDIPTAFIQRVFTAMNENPQHTFQILTKRSKRLYELSSVLNWSDNIWMGVTVENNDTIDRIDDLRLIPAGTRFLSMEPLLGPVPDLNLEGINWVIVGGESGPGARPVYIDWVREIRDRCIDWGVPFFFKQWGGVNKKKNGRLLDERTWDEMPELVVA